MIPKFISNKKIRSNSPASVFHTRSDVIGYTVTQINVPSIIRPTFTLIHRSKKTKVYLTTT